MTEYRTYNDGYCDWLQYRKSVFFGLFKVWRYVPYPHKRMSTGEEGDMMGWDNHVCSYTYGCKKFVSDYPNIEDWWPEYNKRMKSLRERYAESEKTRRDKMGYTKLT